MITDVVWRAHGIAGQGEAALFRIGSLLRIDQLGEAEIANFDQSFRLCGGNFQGWRTISPEELLPDFDVIDDKILTLPWERGNRHCHGTRHWKNEDFSDRENQSMVKFYPLKVSE